ncbi:MAG: GMC family oxidoreductase [Paracoccaceae bacterium]|nr:GMC family oxidoreductase [Paracoccaceae bacterium]MDE2911913.1 GMC family oxidoreductase [Paracoccaceae bacterium]
MVSDARSWPRGRQARPGVQFDANLLQPRSRGRVRLAPADPLTRPIIDPGFLANPGDLGDVLEALEQIREIAAQRPLAKALDGETFPGLSLRGIALIESVRNRVTTGHHPVATCRMGPDHELSSVLDSALRVRGVERLRVANASSFPGQIRGNPNATVIMLAEKAPDLILGRGPPEWA